MIKMTIFLVHHKPNTCLLFIQVGGILAEHFTYYWTNFSLLITIMINTYIVIDVYPQVIRVCFHNLDMSITWAWVGCVFKAQMFFIQQTIRLLYWMKLHDFWGIRLSPPLPVSQDQEDTGPGIQPMRAQSSIFSCPLLANLFDSIYVTSTILTCRSTFKWCMKDMNWKNV